MVFLSLCCSVICCEINKRWRCSGTRDAALLSHFSRSEINSCRSCWHFCVSVTTQLAAVLHAAQQIDSPKSCSALADSQTALIGTTNLFLCISRELIQVRHLNSTEGDRHLVKSHNLYNHFSA